MVASDEPQGRKVFAQDSDVSNGPVPLEQAMSHQSGRSVNYRVQQCQPGHRRDKSTHQESCAPNRPDNVQCNVGGLSMLCEKVFSIERPKAGPTGVENVWFH
jgi:hypothetical protein